jgi:hypothetical protein
MRESMSAAKPEATPASTRPPALVAADGRLVDRAADLRVRAAQGGEHLRVEGEVLGREICPRRDDGREGVSLEEQRADGESHPGLLTCMVDGDPSTPRAALVSAPGLR